MMGCLGLVFGKAYVDIQLGLAMLVIEAAELLIEKID